MDILKCLLGFWFFQTIALFYFIEQFMEFDENNSGDIGK